MVLRNWMIDYFIGEVDEVTRGQEIGFYAVMSMPVVLFVLTMVLVW